MAKTLSSKRVGELVDKFAVSIQVVVQTYNYMRENVEDVDSLTELAELAQDEIGEIGDDPEEFYAEMAFFFESEIGYGERDDDKDDWLLAV